MTRTQTIPAVVITLLIAAAPILARGQAFAELKNALVADKVTAKCDAIDGLKDGLIEDPRKCTFDPRRDVPICSAGSDGADCLTAAQAETIAKVYSGPVSNGKPFFPGYMRAAKPSWVCLGEAQAAAAAGPMTSSVNGKQYVTIMVGSTLFTFGLRE